MNISTLFDQVLKDGQEGLHDDLVEETPRYLSLLFVCQRLVVVVVVGLIGQLVEEIRIGQEIHSSVVTMDEGLLVDLVLDGHEQLVVLGREGLDVGEEGGKTVGIEAVHGLFGWRIVLDERLQDVLILHVEDLVLESKEEFGVFVEGDLVLEEL
jgi:hypothetical protein